MFACILNRYAGGYAVCSGGCVDHLPADSRHCEQLHPVLPALGGQKEIAQKTQEVRLTLIRIAVSLRLWIFSNVISLTEF